MPTLAGNWAVDQAALGGGTTTTPSFTPQAGDILVVKTITADSSLSTTGTPTGGGWTYTSRISDLTASHVGAKLWTAPVTAGGTAQTVALTFSGSDGRGKLIVELWRGAQLAASPVTVDTRGSGAPSTTLTPAKAGSVISWTNGDWAAVDGASRVYNTTSATPVETGYSFVTGAFTSYSAYQTAAAASAQTLGLTAPTGQTWTLIGIEIQDATPVLLTNSAEGVTPSGTTVTLANSGGASGSAFDVVTLPSGGSIVSDSAQAAHGALSYLTTIGATAAEAYYGWTTSIGALGSAAPVYTRAYLYITANPGTAFKLITVMTGASAACGSVLLSTTGKLSTLNAAGTVIATTTNSVPLNAWCRVELDVTPSTTAGVLTARLYSSPDDTTATETISSSSQVLTAGPINQVRFGPRGTLVASVSFRFDDVGITDAGPMGPAAAAVPVLVPVHHWRKRRWRQTPQPDTAIAAAADLTGQAAPAIAIATAQPADGQVGLAATVAPALAVTSAQPANSAAGLAATAVPAVAAAAALPAAGAAGLAATATPALATAVTPSLSAGSSLTGTAPPAVTLAASQPAAGALGLAAAVSPAVMVAKAQPGSGTIGLSGTAVPALSAAVTPALSAGAALAGAASVAPVAAVTAPATATFGLSGQAVPALVAVRSQPATGVISVTGTAVPSIAAVAVPSLSAGSALIGTTAPAIIVARAQPAVSSAGLTGLAAPAVAVARAQPAASVAGITGQANLAVVLAQALPATGGIPVIAVPPPSLVLTVAVPATAVLAAGAPGSTGQAEWRAGLLPRRWQASASGARYQAELAPCRWQAQPAASRWTAAGLPGRWRVVMAEFKPVWSGSLEEVPVVWTSDLAGTTVDPVAQNLTVQMAFKPSSGDISAPAAPTAPDWKAASWVMGTTIKGFVAVCLVGPGGTLQLTAGKYDVWSKITATPQIPAQFAGVLTVTP